MDFASRKLQCGGKLILLRFPDGTRLQIRLLTYKEFLIFQSLYLSNTISHNRIDDLIFQTVVQDEFVTAEWLSDQRAGICTTVASLVTYMGSNHYNSQDDTFIDMLNAARLDAQQSFDNTMFSIICRAFPSYRFLDLEQLTFAEILKLFACAEKFLLESGVLKEPINIGRADKPEHIKTAPKEQFIVTKGMEGWSQRAWGGDNEAEILRHDLAIEASKNKQESLAFDSPEVKDSIKRYNDIVAQRKEQATKRKRDHGKF